MKEDLTQDYLRWLVTYYPESGKMYWRVHVSPERVGKEAGSVDSNGYKLCRIGDRHYGVHRLAFLYMTGSLPPEDVQVDHRNGIREDNRWGNLRLCSRSQNQQNTKRPVTNNSGIKGLTKIPAPTIGGTSPCYRGQISKDRKRYTLDRSFIEGDKVSEAKALAEVTNWLITKREELHGEFTNHG